MRGRLAIIENMLVEDLRNFLFSVDNLVDFMDALGYTRSTKVLKHPTIMGCKFFGVLHPQTLGIY